LGVLLSIVSQGLSGDYAGVMKGKNMLTEATRTAREVFSVCRNEIGLTFNGESATELNGNMECNSDFTVEIDGGEYRFISEDVIRDIAQEEISDLVQECYLGGQKELPWWIEIDWNKTVQNCIDADGYGHHFSGYDGNEYEVAVDSIIEWYVFRTN
jgi:hypothetical protein